MLLGSTILFGKKSKFPLKVRCYKPNWLGRLLGQKIKWSLVVEKHVPGEYRVIGGSELSQGDELEITTSGLRIAVPGGEYFYIRSWEVQVTLTATNHRPHTSEEFTYLANGKMVRGSAE